jgi:hypothetical protein
VNPSVSRADVLQGTARTVLVEAPSGAMTFRPGPALCDGSGPVEYGVFAEPAGA